LRGTFVEKKVKYVSERTLALCSKNSTFSNVSYIAPKVLLQLRKIFFWKTYIFHILYNWKQKNLSPNRHA